LFLDVAPPALRAYRQSFIEPDRYGLDRLPADVGFLQTAVVRPADSTFYAPPVAPFAAAGIGAPAGYTVIPIRVCAIPRQSPEYRGEAFLLGGVGRFKPVVTARRIEVVVQADAPDTLILNMNWARGWAVVEPATLTCRPHSDGRLAVDVPAGTTHMTLRYTSPGLLVGLLLFALGGPAVLALAFRLPVETHLVSSAEVTPA
jgi:hypothetical protein